MGTIIVANIRTYRPKPGEAAFRIDRQTPVGNPFYMSDESKRDMVCDMYEAYFKGKVLHMDDDKFMAYLQNILDTVRSGRNVVLLCWCAPKRCHGETIKRWLLSQL